jgi:nucleoside-diphosphate-sugar epimerase
MRAIVTGAAGFIGSHLCSYLLDRGDEVIGVDSLTDFYDPQRKEANIALLAGRDGFTLYRLDLTSAPLAALFQGADVVYHLAGEPGARRCWGDQFSHFVRGNVTATQRVLEAAQQASFWKVVYASSAAVYGESGSLPMHEEMRPHPMSPYGVTTLAAESLCELFRTTTGLPTVSLRLFTVYGPRQRPDMAFARLVDTALRNEPFLLFGDGEQSRDFVFVDDVVAAMRQAALSPWSGIANIGLGSSSTMNQVIATLREIGVDVDVVHLPPQSGHMPHTAADISRARRGFGYAPAVTLRRGLERMVEARRDLFAADTPMPLKLVRPGPDPAPDEAQAAAYQTGGSL